MASKRVEILKALGFKKSGISYKHKHFGDTEFDLDEIKTEELIQWMYNRGFYYGGDDLKNKLKQLLSIRE